MSVIAGCIQKESSALSDDTLFEEFDASTSFVVADTKGTWSDENCRLYVKRRIIYNREKSSNVPWYSEQHPYAVALEGHLFNREELIESLSLDEHCPDEEIITEAYTKWGYAAFLKHLYGEFSFAIWDSKKRELILAVDHLASIPLYYGHQSGVGIVFSTEMHPILVALGVQPAINHRKSLQYLSRIPEFSSDQTLIDTVRLVRPGHCIRFTESFQQQSTKYWDVGFRNDRQPKGSYDEVVSTFLNKLEKSVSVRIPEVGSTTSHLTGGLDSTAVTAVAAQHLKESGKGIFTCSIVPNIPDSGKELAEAEEDTQRVEDFINTHPEIQNQYIEGSGIPVILEGFPACPSTNSISEALNRTNDFAASRGSRVILTGYGSEAGCGTRVSKVFLPQFVKGMWKWCWENSRHMSPVWGLRLARLMKRMFEEAIGLRSSFHIRFYRKRIRRFCCETHLSPRSARKLVPFSRLVSRDPVLMDLEWALNLRTYEEKRFAKWRNLGRRTGLFYRYPLLDRNLLEYVYRLSIDYHFKDGVHRYLLREAMKGRIPDRICWGKKSVYPSVNSTNQKAYFETAKAQWQSFHHLLFPYIKPEILKVCLSKQSANSLFRLLFDFSLYILNFHYKAQLLSMEGIRKKEEIKLDFQSGKWRKPRVVELSISHTQSGSSPTVRGEVTTYECTPATPGSYTYGRCAS